MRPLSLLFVLLPALLLLTTGIPLSSQPARPNVIFILADDLGYGDLGITGHPYARSPHIDGLARDGIRFTQAYMAGAWCSPSRYALLSGVYPARRFLASHRLETHEPTITRFLDEAGYATAHFGKWHVGDRKVEAAPPESYGIDESFSTQSTGPTWSPVERRAEHYREKTTARYVDLAIDFMRRHREEPFYLNLWVYPTHSYINPTTEQRAAYRDLKVNVDDFENPLQREFLELISRHGDLQQAMQAYCADVTALDTEIGRLLEELALLGLEENTVVIFSSDNGPGPLSSDWDAIVRRYQKQPLLLNNVGSAGPFRDRKASLHEGGIRVPFILRWPRAIPAGTVDDTTILCGVDFLPTVAALTGTPLPQLEIDGEDLSEAVRGHPQTREKPLFWSDRPQWVALREGPWKAHRKGPDFFLYHLGEDPSESHNRADRQPELADAFMRRLQAWSQVIHKPAH